MPTPIAGGPYAAIFASILAFSQVDSAVYVDSVLGSDTNDGTITRPVATVPVGAAKVPASHAKKCRLVLVGVGPYAVPAGFQWTPSVAVGPSAEPMIVVGSFVQVGGTGTTGTISSITANVMTPVTGGMTVNAFRGHFVRFLTGAGAGRTVPITSNDATTISTYGNWSGFVATDTYEIVRAAAQITGTTMGIMGPERIMFYGVRFSHTSTTSIGSFANILFDACMFDGASNLMAIDGGSFVRSLIVVGAPGFDMITDVGSWAIGSNTSVHFGSTGTMFFQAGGQYYGYMSTNMKLVTDSVGTQGNNIFLLGFDQIITAASGIGISIGGNSGLTIRNFTNAMRMVGPSSGGTGILVQDGGTAFVAAAVMTGWSTDAIRVDSGGFIDLTSVSGSAGNGTGLRVQNGGRARATSTTVTGTSEVVIDGQASKTWAAAGTVIRSQAGMQGMVFDWVGGFTGAAGATTAYIATGGLPGSTLGTHYQTSAAFGRPVPRGGLAKDLRGLIQANSLAGTTTVTVLKAPAATGTFATTALVFSIGAGVTGAFSDVTHTVQFEDGDQVGLQMAETGAGAITGSFSLRMAA